MSPSIPALLYTIKDSDLLTGDRLAHTDISALAIMEFVLSLY